MTRFGPRILLVFFIALGVVLGATLVGSLAAVLVGEPPVKTMARLAQEIKIWAIVAAIGGTFTTLEVLELGIFGGDIRSVIKQLLYILGAFSGAQLGNFLINALAGGKH